MLCAEALVRGAGRGFFAPIGKVLADPRLLTVRALVGVEALYPTQYPLPRGWHTERMRRVTHAIERRLVGALVRQDALQQLDHYGLRKSP